jgi:hypothetical protein
LHDNDVDFENIEHGWEGFVDTPWMIGKWIADAIDIPGSEPHDGGGNMINCTLTRRVHIVEAIEKLQSHRQGLLNFWIYKHHARDLQFEEDVTKGMTCDRASARAKDMTAERSGEQLPLYDRQASR